ncbi:MULTISPECIES: nitrilase-related carbon-nitrogen hydrolase [Mameliella]|uniref:nitrilase-related carbon-nitrogen hydrolase n=1 Tax=Mameliella TaxID=1434019 RepID=UPI0012FF914C|nr:MULTISPECIES: nitrilase-related carbon-nitrogen hydrolase [Mameliella]MCR9274425.1 hydrolase [Paracoccaceae bacterium]
MRLALAQAPGELSTVVARLDRLRVALPGIAADGADRGLLPELFACGYNIGDAVHERAEPANGRIFGAMRDLSREAGVAIHYGFAEAADGGPQLGALCLSARSGPDPPTQTGDPAGVREALLHAGTEMPVFRWRGVTCATLICYDAEFPETLRHVATEGAQLVLVPTALGAQWLVVAQNLIPTRVFENGVYVVYANSAGTENGLAFLGASCIVAPDGTAAARAGAAAEILMADLDIGRVHAAQSRLRYLDDRRSLRLDGDQSDSIRGRTTRDCNV